MQSSLVESLFAGDPFFERSRILWPLYHGPLSDMREDFIQRRSALADSFLKEISGVFPYDFLKGGAFASSRLAGRRGDVGEARRPSSEGNLELSLDVREFSPEDITVKLAGRQLAVVAASKSEEAPANRKGFVQKIGLPDNVDPSAITCSLTADGLLKIEAPAVQRGASEERTVPIRFRTSLNFPINNTNKEDGQDVPEKNN
ncbi:heat shock protein beta-9 [Anguilla anguilla]|uniref:heat shock protein beta-9 n=1 Tax=Anguilla anguilla TaxID=7936 RepID=UPI0015A7D5A9|nr:heat shock protein beta-9 [Anguilla anguilla]